MREIILEVLADYAKIHINMESESARQLLAKDLEEALSKYVNNLIEEIVVGQERESFDE